MRTERSRMPARVAQRIAFVLMGLVIAGCGADAADSQADDFEPPVSESHGYEQIVADVQAIECDVPPADGTTAPTISEPVFSCLLGAMNGIDSRQRYDTLEAEQVCAALDAGYADDALSNDDRRVAASLLASFVEPASTVSVAEASAALGSMIAFDHRERYPEVDLSIFCESFSRSYREVTLGSPVSLAAADLVAAYYNQRSALRTAAAIETGSALLEQNRQRPGVIETASGVQFETVTAGDGLSVDNGDTVMVAYAASLADGSLFDRVSGEDIRVGTGQVPTGFDEALLLMSAGGRYRIVLPPALAYGAFGFGELVPPEATVVFEVDIVSVTENT